MFSPKEIDQLYKARYANRLGHHTLYKFRPYWGKWVEYVRQIICDNRVYFSRASQLNDPFDMAPIHKLAGDPNSAEFRTILLRDLRRMMKQDRGVPLERQIRAMQELRKLPNPEELAKQATLQSRAELDRTLPILSLTSSRRHPLFWSHYADAHKGLCLHFRCDDSESPFAYARKVNYRMRRPVLPVPLDQNAIDEIADRIALTKAPWWRYEHEFRVLATKGHDMPIVIDGQYGQYDPRWLIGITLGAFMPRAEKEQLVAIGRGHDPALEVWQSSETESYRLKFNRLH